MKMWQMWKLALVSTLFLMNGAFAGPGPEGAAADPAHATGSDAAPAAEDVSARPYESTRDVTPDKKLSKLDEMIDACMVGRRSSRDGDAFLRQYSR